MHDNVYIHLVQLPGKINEAVCPCEGGYNISIDPRQSVDGIMRSFQHAMTHIENNDFEKSDVQNIETEAHNNEIYKKCI